LENGGEWSWYLRRKVVREREEDGDKTFLVWLKKFEEKVSEQKILERMCRK
jgi:hypothetical protein